MGQVSTSWGEGVVALGVVVVVVMVTVAVAVVVVVVVTVGVVVVVTVVDRSVLRREKMPKKREKVRDFIFDLLPLVGLVDLGLFARSDAGSLDEAYPFV